MMELVVNESLVSYEVAIALNEIGFDDECLYVFHIHFKVLWKKTPAWRTHKWLIPAPTIQMAIAWLEQKHHIYVMPAPYKPGEWKTIMVYTDHPNPEDGKLNVCELDGIHKSHDEAANYGLKYGLDLVKKIQGADDPRCKDCKPRLCKACNEFERKEE